MTGHIHIVVHTREYPPHIYRRSLMNYNVGLSRVSSLGATICSTRATGSKAVLLTAAIPRAAVIAAIDLLRSVEAATACTGALSNGADVVLEAAT